MPGLLEFFSSVRQKFYFLAKNFKRNEVGNIALLFAVTVIPTIVAVGAAIDYSRASQVETAMQTALDSAALHLGSLPQNSSQSVLEADAANFFDANYQGIQDINFDTIQVVRDGIKITLTAVATMDTTFMRIVSINTMDVGAVSQISAGGGTVEIALVLDNSGSMTRTKMSALKTAARSLVDTLYDSLPPNSTDLSFSLVPFSAFVNVGANNNNARWMDTQGRSPIHSENFSRPRNRFTLYNYFTNRSWRSCVESRPYPNDVNDSRPSTRNPETLFVPSFNVDEPDINGYWNNYLPDRTSGNDRRRMENVYKYRPGTLVTPLYYWFPQGPGQSCTVQRLTPLTKSQTKIVTNLRWMVGSSNTNMITGLSWGWRTLSPGQPFAEGRSYSDSRNQKVLILLTDGKNDLFMMKHWYKSSYSSYGYIRNNRLGTLSSNRSVVTRKMNERTAEVCEGIKDAGIILYTITFDLNDSDTLDLMRACASSGAHYFNSPTSSQLNDVFAEIATKLQRLRLSR